MKNNKDIIIICATIALCILAIDIILTFIAGLYSFCAILIILFIISLIVLIVFATKKDKILKKKYNPLTNIEDTIILKLEDLKSESILPIRNSQTIEIIDDTSIKRNLQEQREKNVTKEVIEEELGKTIFIKDLKDKMKLYEQEQELLRQKEEEQELKELNELIKNKNK